VREQLVDYGVLETTNGKLSRLNEKPRMCYEVSMGVYMMSKRALDFVPEDTAYGFDNLMHELVAAEQGVAVCKYSGYWLDIGRPDDYAQAIDEFDSMRNKFIS